jgi:hypothetical protein
VHLDRNSIVEVMKIRSIVVEILVKNKIKMIHIKDVLYVHKVQTYLLLVSKLLLN